MTPSSMTTWTAWLAIRTSSSPLITRTPARPSSTWFQFDKHFFHFGDSSKKLPSFAIGKRFPYLWSGLAFRNRHWKWTVGKISHSWPKRVKWKSCTTFSKIPGLNGILSKHSWNRLEIFWSLLRLSLYARSHVPFTNELSTFRCVLEVRTVTLELTNISE